MKQQYNDYPLQECVESVERMIIAGDLLDVQVVAFQKFTCDKCGARQTIEEPNVFYTSGKCQECEHVTMIKKCNYLLTMQPAIPEQVNIIMKAGEPQ